MPRPYKSRRNTSSLPASSQPAGTTITPTIALSGDAPNSLRLTGDLPFVVRALPTRVTVQGNPPTSFVVVSPTVVKLLYAAPPAAGQQWVVNANCDEIRSQSGGRLAASRGLF